MTASLYQEKPWTLAIMENLDKVRQYFIAGQDWTVRGGAPGPNSALSRVQKLISQPWVKD